MDKGVYCLVLRNRACRVRTGALGVIRYRAGFHVYTGSAQGSGGLQRVVRHIGLAKNKDRAPKWHIDYLLTHKNFSLASVVCAPTGKTAECSLAQSLGGDLVPEFGCSDCTCTSHLSYFPSDPLDDVVRAFVALDLAPVITTLITPNAESIL